MDWKLVLRLERDFFARYTPVVAKELIGNVLVRAIDGVIMSGRIVEAEAYRGSEDPASHAYRGMTKRNAVMFGEAGHSYVYFTYGNHHLLNFTTETEGTPGAVLIRALEPIEGVREMLRNRGITDVGEASNGPGKLTKAMLIDLHLNAEDIVTSPRLYVRKVRRRDFKVRSTSRIGIGEGGEYDWRYYMEDNPFVSKGKLSQG